jgi:hypothetical protein
MGTLISSRSTFITKWLFPIAWFGFLFFFIAQSLRDGTSGEDLLFVAVPVLMAVFGSFFFKALVWDLADSVFDHGTYLVVRRRGVEETISLDNIMNVSSTPFMNPPRITLRLVKPGAFGTHVSFSPKSSLFSLRFFSKNMVAEQLMERTFAARARRAG